MNRHTQSYFDLNPEPSAASLFWRGLKYIALMLYAVGFVYGLTVLLFSF